jgi:thiamine-phosphate pyrophosphorylase
MTTMTAAKTSIDRTDRRTLADRVAGVYLLTADVGPGEFDAMAARFGVAVTAGVAIVQYRNKRASAAERRAQAQVLQALARRHGALFVVNDDIDLAVELEADGVHLGRHDGDIAVARRRLPDLLLGVSCYNDLELARRAVDAGADLLAFGSVFASITKPAAVRASLELLRDAREQFPQQRVVAIGGIDATNIGSVSAAGAHAAALISAVFDAEDPGQAVRYLQQEFKEGMIQHDTQRTAV